MDEVRQGGGNSNDGNTARRFFIDADKSAEVTQLNASLIKRCGTILQVSFKPPGTLWYLIRLPLIISFFSTGACFRICSRR